MSLFPHDVSCNFCSSCCGQCYRFHFSKGSKGEREDGISLYPPQPFPSLKQILLLGNISVDQMSLTFFFFFLHVSLNSWQEYQLKLFTTSTLFLFVSR